MGLGEGPRESGGAEADSCEDAALEAGGLDTRRAMEEARGSLSWLRTAGWRAAGPVWLRPDHRTGSLAGSGEPRLDHRPGCRAMAAWQALSACATQSPWVQS